MARRMKDPTDYSILTIGIVYYYDVFWKTNFGTAQEVSYPFDLMFGGKPFSFCGHIAIRHLTGLRD